MSKNLKVYLAALFLVCGMWLTLVLVPLGEPTDESTWFWVSLTIILTIFCAKSFLVFQRKNRNEIRTYYFLLISVVALLCVGWVSASLSGKESVRKSYEKLVTEGIDSVGIDPSQYRFFDYNVMFDESEGDDRVDPPWYYIANERAVLPFTVSIDWGVMHGPLFGSGGKDYWLYFFGYELRIASSLMWNS